MYGTYKQLTGGPMKRIPTFYLHQKLTYLFVLMFIATPLFAQEISVTTDSNEAKSLFVEGRTLYDNIRFDEARDIFDQALMADADFALAHTYRALTATSDKDFENHLTKAVEIKNNVSDGERLLIESLQADANNNRTEAIAKLEEATSLYPQDKRLHHILGVIYQNSDMFDEAESQFNEAIVLDANFAPAYNNLGYLYKANERYDEAKDAFENYVRLLPEEANPHDSIADLYTKTGEYDMAIEHYQKALNMNPNFYFSQQKIGDNMLFKGLYEDGRTAYRQAIEMTPVASNKVFIHQAIANSYLYEDDPEKALEETDAAIKWAKDESLPELAASLYQVKALINLEQNNFAESQKALMAYETLTEENDFSKQRKSSLDNYALRNQVIQYAKAGDFVKAEEKATKMRTVAEESGNKNDMKLYHMLTGIIAYEQGNFDKAINALTQSDTQNPYGQYYLALSYQKSGMNTDAKNLFAKIANWNEHSVEYALVKNRALASSKIDMAIED